MQYSIAAFPACRYFFIAVERNASHSNAGDMLAKSRKFGGAGQLVVMGLSKKYCHAQRYQQR